MGAFHPHAPSGGAPATTSKQKKVHFLWGFLWGFTPTPP